MATVIDTPLQPAILRIILHHSFVPILLSILFRSLSRTLFTLQRVRALGTCDGKLKLELQRPLVGTAAVLWILLRVLVFANEATALRFEWRRSQTAATADPHSKIILHKS